MTPAIFTAIFLATLLATVVLRLWLLHRHLSHIAAHRDVVPIDFAKQITLAEHQKAADYVTAKGRLSRLEIFLDVVVLLAFTLGGVLQFFATQLHDFFGAGYWHGVALFGLVSVVGFLLSLPFDLFRTFRIEASFGFNKITPKLWLLDIFKGTGLAIAIGVPLLLTVFWLMDVMGERWWIYVWLVWMGFNLLVLFLFPTVIAPLFNKFTPLQDEALKTRIEALLTRCGFTTSGLFVMDGSRRSSHGNAYFSGFGRAKRIVFFDTLLERLTPPEIDAVLAHELGHFRHKHIVKRIVFMAFASLALLWLLAQLMTQPWFFIGLGVTPVGAGDTPLALLLFSMVMPVFMFLLSPLSAAVSRRHEFQADAYAASHAAASELISALVKLYRDNASTLTPDPLHSLFYDSHPPAATRIAHLRSL
ncbi:MAG: M48 family metallopeptidase [Rhodocyclaceae bacterium]|nr:M48 family metallopeptidase [Rhodocyclaceae bacterium]MBL0076682.1 M48 family metallopeptidase [Rhodocyclaceae bacterium]MBP6110130.1 M48 family metallopeptidase [Rhodocyclaceae bacterium]